MLRRVVGGPYDGAVVTRSITTAITWLGGRAEPHVLAEDGTFPYWVNGNRLHYAGHGFRICKGCGAWIDPDTKTGGPTYPCPLCGENESS
jgi:hypothetical protein